ncbi:PH domain-containing protein [Actinocrispum wychmicini]|uniref:Putative oligomerization/nucleic acid binding protein n=1 Tax=Actinocrispum wychmicini TaxID=1213861 RepID=A0A4R2IYU2_9PSEU|nr:PH domain-containing protein [Actinocrispum wychmicini]TCO50744.1 putative oligomerization/nucleic acid binding protein [Actinocrispum wychmicini]
MADALRPDVQAAKDRMQAKLGAGREIKRLVDYLWEGEQVELMASGTYGPGVGLVVLTDRRLLFLKDGVMRQVTEDFPLDKVSSVQWSAGLALGSFTIFASGNKAEIKSINKKDGKQIADAARERLANRAHPNPSTPPAVTAVHGSTGDVYEQLRKLGELHEAGVLTADEFNTKKQELLNRL